MGGYKHSANSVDEVLEHCEVCRAPGTAPHVPDPGAFTVSTYNEKLEVRLPSLDGIIALPAMGLNSKFFLSIPLRLEILRKFGALFGEQGSGSLDSPRVFKWMKVVNGTAESGRIFSRGAV